MKILAIGRPSPDYLQDDLYHGLKTLPGVQVECNCNIDYLYDDYPHDIKTLYGRGISYAKNLPAAIRLVVNDADITEKLAGDYYDALIYLSARRCLDFKDQVSATMPDNRVAFVDGEDDTAIVKWSFGINFKREIDHHVDGVLPISFAIPKEKIVNSLTIKSRFISAQIPNGNRKYSFETEEEYYHDYRRSMFAITQKKAGWDCKRHYEILACGCIPVFLELEKCPPYTMTTLNKDFLIEVKKSFQHANFNLIESWGKRLLEITKEHLTTEALARYVLSKLG
jgi:hypothetical protein